MEFGISVQCPHCDDEFYTHIEFDDSIWTPDGACGDQWKKEYCHNCDKNFYFNAMIQADVSFEYAEKKKPKGVTL